MLGSSPGAVWRRCHSHEGGVRDGVRPENRNFLCSRELSTLDLPLRSVGAPRMPGHLIPSDPCPFRKPGSRWLTSS
jgi:hypothetical protein